MWVDDREGDGTGLEVWLTGDCCWHDLRKTARAVEVERGMKVSVAGVKGEGARRSGVSAGIQPPQLLPRPLRTLPGSGCC